MGLWSSSLYRFVICLMFEHIEQTVCAKGSKVLAFLLSYSLVKQFCFFSEQFLCLQCSVLRDVIV